MTLEIVVSNKSFFVNREDIKICKLINDMIDDDDENEEAEKINITGSPEFFEKIIEFVNLYSKNFIESNELNNFLLEWNKIKKSYDLPEVPDIFMKFISDIIKEPENKEYFTDSEKEFMRNFLDFCNYVGCEKLLHLGCHRIEKIISKAYEQDYTDAIKLLNYKYWSENIKE